MLRVRGLVTYAGAMPVVTVERYRVLTRDNTTASASVEAALEVAEQAVADYLRRDDLGLDVRTERLRLHPSGKVYPAHVPIVEVAATATYRAENGSILEYVSADDITHSVGEWPVRRTDDYPHTLPYATVVFTGGWTLATMPIKVQAVVAEVAQVLAGAKQPAGAGVESASVGDVSVSYRDGMDSDGQWLDTQVHGATARLAGSRWRGDT